MPSIPPAPFSVLSENSDYPASAKVPQFKGLDFTSNDLAHALFTTGRAPGDRYKYGHASFYEALHRCAVIPAYVRRTGAGELMRSRLAAELDRSEKGSLSYALGQAMTTIFCNKVLGTTHLLHIDRYSDQEKVLVKNPSDKSRADLFGPSPSGWVVAEAKGRTHNSDQKLVTKLKSQKGTVATIQGKKPWLTTGCVACFPQPKYPVMRVLTWDPEDTEDDAIDIDGTMDDYLRAYYAPMMSALALGDDVDGEADFVTTRVSGLNMTLGLRGDLYRALADQAINDRDPTDDFDAALVARLALGDLYDTYATDVASPARTATSNRTDMETGYVLPQSVQTDSDTTSGPGQRGPEQPARDDEDPPIAVFADGTIFETDWNTAISLDDLEPMS